MRNLVSAGFVVTCVTFSLGVCSYQRNPAALKCGGCLCCEPTTGGRGTHALGAGNSEFGSGLSDLCAAIPFLLPSCGIMACLGEWPAAAALPSTALSLARRFAGLRQWELRTAHVQRQLRWQLLAA